MTILGDRLLSRYLKGKLTEVKHSKATGNSDTI